MSTSARLVDGFGRVHTDLRLSVTDRCNIRCFYCMPAEVVRFKPRAEILTFEEMTRFVRVVARLGVRSVRLTGGEPLVRQNLPRLVAMLAAVPGIEDLALTTNGMLLAEQAAALKQAGLHRLNVSLDALSEATFERIARRRGLQRVLDGLSAAHSAGFTGIKLNAVSIRGLTEDEIVPLARFARQQGFELRFIEFMPLDAEGNWANRQVLSGDEVAQIIAREVAPLVPLARNDPAQPATDFAYVDGRGRVGFINPVTQAFCAECDRLRLTAEGRVRNCLFSTVEWDVRPLLRGEASDDEIAALVQDCVAEKKAGHGINSDEFVRPERAMYQIGG
ncbi:MAG: GTP 3',8-cyclase MoaA [Pirellulales bacterium]|nr:GTP 3',8-cyclase MoaA [Pirellulales bacterium]